MLYPKGRYTKPYITDIVSPLTDLLRWLLEMHPLSCWMLWLQLQHQLQDILAIQVITLLQRGAVDLRTNTASHKLTHKMMRQH